EGDARLLAGAVVSMLFTGTLQQFFPAARDAAAIPPRDPGPDAAGLEGEFRPGHFAGVATIVARLFEGVRPARAYFGAKDFQQPRIVRHLARERGETEIVVCPTSRDPDGLARSSRNQLLGEEDRRRALVLSRALRAARDTWRAGERDPRALERVVQRELPRQRVDGEYAAVRDPQGPAELPRGPLTRARALRAARVGPHPLVGQ